MEKSDKPLSKGEKKRLVRKIKPLLRREAYVRQVLGKQPGMAVEIKMGGETILIHAHA